MDDLEEEAEANKAELEEGKATLVDYISNYPEHPDIQTWIDDLKIYNQSLEELAPIFEQIYENRAAIVEARKELD